jgi:hypothetical protein
VCDDDRVGLSCHVEAPQDRPIKFLGVVLVADLGRRSVAAVFARPADSGR